MFQDVRNRLAVDPEHPRRFTLAVASTWHFRRSRLKSYRLHLPALGWFAAALSYQFRGFPEEKGATAGHAIYGGQWRRLDRG
ncbi:hypothetical protein, partial [Roseovarius sp. D22-M7]|uniref:hypothetical protein n=1 Tax=Roseovarius sp. D22-M7 TaxID=3127116 RepID=UPI00300F9F73